MPERKSKEYKPGRLRHAAAGAALGGMAMLGVLSGLSRLNSDSDSSPAKSGDRQTSQTIDKHKTPQYKKAEQEAMIKLYDKTYNILDGNTVEYSKAKKSGEASFKPLFILDGVRVEMGEEHFTYPAFSSF